MTRVPSNDRRPAQRHDARTRVPLFLSLLLIAGCALAAYWVTAASGGAPPALPIRTTAEPESSEALVAARRIHVPLSPMAHDVQALGDRRSPSARSWDGLRVRLPASLPPPVRLPSVPITVPFEPGHFADYDTGLDEFDLDEAFEEGTGTVPLLWIEGEEDAWLTPGFRVADFASRDGSTLARISYRLVDGLERLRQEAGSLGIISGYRNSAHNAAVGGVAHSQHLEGKAADVWSAHHAPLDLARLALQTLGCEIGLGLGPRSLHVDVRGELVTWTYPGAAMPNAAFDAWALAHCGLPVPEELAQLAAEAWLSDPAAGADTLTADASPTDLLAHYHASVVEAARTGYDLQGPGAVVLDLRAGVPPSSYLPPSTLRYVPAYAPEAADLGVGALIDWRERGRQHAYFVYAVLTPGAPPAVGVSSYAAPRAAPVEESASALASGEQPEAEPAAAWTIVVASRAERAQAEAAASRYRAVLDANGHPVAVRYDDDSARYRVTAGRFPTPDAAERVLTALGPELPSDAWVYQR